MSLQISCGWQREMSGVPCRRRPRFDYTLSQSSWTKKHRPLPEPKWRLGWENRPHTVTWSAIQSIVMEKPWNMGLSKMPQSEIKTQKYYIYLLLTPGGLEPFHPASLSIIFLLGYSFHKGHGKVFRHVHVLGITLLLIKFFQTKFSLVSYQSTN